MKTIPINITKYESKVLLQLCKHITDLNNCHNLKKELYKARNYFQWEQDKIIDNSFHPLEIGICYLDEHPDTNIVIEHYIESNKKIAFDFCYCENELENIVNIQRDQKFQEYNITDRLNLQRAWTQMPIKTFIKTLEKLINLLYEDLLSCEYGCEDSYEDEIGREQEHLERVKRKVGKYVL